MPSISPLVTAISQMLTVFIIKIELAVFRINMNKPLWVLAPSSSLMALRINMLYSDLVEYPGT